MPHSIWRGTISFGLVTIPVALYPAEHPRELAFHLLDERDMSPVHNLRVNSATGKEVPWEHAVRGFEVEKDHFVVVTDDDLRSANVEATRTIDVLAAVCATDIPPELLSAPYFLVPEKAGRTAYTLLREALHRAARVAVGKIVIRTRQHLVALMPREDLLLLEVLRYPYEVRSTADLDLPGASESDLAAAGVTAAELDLAAQLVATISKAFDASAPEYRDTYRDDVLALIKTRAAGGEVKVVEAPAEQPSAVVDITELLRRSLESAKRA